MVALELRLAMTFAGLTGAVALAPWLVADGVALDALEASTVGISAAASVVYGRRVSRVVREVSRFAERVACGELSGRVEPCGVPELSQLATAVNGMAARLAREGHARASFIGKVSHELRTPLTVIRGYTYTLQRSEHDPAKTAKLDVITGECERLAYLIEDLLELSRARTGELRISSEAFALRDCVAEVSERLEPVAGQRDVRVELEWAAGDTRVMGDENRIRQLLANLLTNGIKYAPPGTAVRVRGYSAGADVAIEVADTGRGIAPRDLPRIFDAFYQAPDRAEPGAGLGLAIARELAEAHGGRIEVESVVGEGTTFTARLPAWEPV